MSALNMFQFYNSPIKTIEGHFALPLSYAFQFYNSPIKTRAEGNR